jgi:hypothetical protein
MSVCFGGAITMLATRDARTTRRFDDIRTAIRGAELNAVGGAAVRIRSTELSSEEIAELLWDMDSMGASFRINDEPWGFNEEGRAVRRAQGEGSMESGDTATPIRRSGARGLGPLVEIPDGHGTRDEDVSEEQADQGMRQVRRAGRTAQRVDERDHAESVLLIAHPAADSTQSALSGHLARCHFVAIAMGARGRSRAFGNSPE